MTSPRTQSQYLLKPKRRLAGKVDPTKIIKPYEGKFVVGAGGVNPGEPVQLDSQGRVVQLTTGSCIGVVNNIIYSYGRSLGGTTRYAENDTVDISRAAVVAIPVTHAVSAGEFVVPDGERKWRPGAYGWPLRAGVQAKMLYNADAGEYMDALIMLPDHSPNPVLGELDLSIQPHPPVFSAASSGTNMAAGRVVGLDGSSKLERSVTNGIGVALAGLSSYAADKKVWVAGPGAVVNMQAGSAMQTGSIVGFGTSNKLITLAGTHKFYFLVLQGGNADAILPCLFHLRP